MYYWLGRVVFQAEVASALELALELALEIAVCISWAEVHLFLCISSMSADSVQYDVGEGWHPAVWF